MANKIDKINVGGADYEINLPTTATPSITSLTVTGNLDVKGTANLSVINVTNSTGGQIGQIGTISSNPSLFVFSAPRSLFISSPVITLTAHALNLAAGSSLSLIKGSYTYSLPNKSGTVALTSDVELWQYTIEISNGKDVFDNKYSLVFSILTSSNFMDVEDNSSNSIDWDDFAAKVFTYNKNLVTYYPASGKRGTVQEDMDFIIGVMFTAIKEVRIKLIRFGGSGVSETSLEKSTGATYKLYARQILGTTAS